MPFIKIDDYKPIELAPGAKARTPYGENIMLSYLELEQGSVIPNHHHPHEQAEMFIIPPDTPHAARPVDGPATVLDVFSPVREDYAALFNEYVREGK